MNIDGIISNVVISRIVDRVVLSASFKIPEKIKKNYKVSGSLDNTKNWKAKVLLANSGGEVGKWDKVDYVLISLNSNNIVPVARADEHQEGMELENYLINNNLISDEEYIPMSTIRHDYFRKSSIPTYLKIYKKALDYGIDPEFQVEDYDSGYVTTIKDFIDNKGEYIDYTKSEKLPPLGQKIIDFFETVANDYKKMVTKNVVRDKEIEDLFYYVLNNIKIFDTYDLSFADYKFDQIKKQIEDADVKHDWEKLGEIMFSHDGLKNKIHIALKKNKDSFDEKRMNAIFGSRERGIKELNRLSNI